MIKFNSCLKALSPAREFSVVAMDYGGCEPYSMVDGCVRISYLERGSRSVRLSGTIHCASLEPSRPFIINAPDPPVTTFLDLFLKSFPTLFSPETLSFLFLWLTSAAARQSGISCSCASCAPAASTLRVRPCPSGTALLPAAAASAPPSHHSAVGTHEKLWPGIVDARRFVVFPASSHGTAQRRRGVP